MFNSFHQTLKDTPLQYAFHSSLLCDLHTSRADFDRAGGVRGGVGGVAAEDGKVGVGALGGFAAGEGVGAVGGGGGVDLDPRA